MTNRPEEGTGPEVGIFLVTTEWRWTIILEREEDSLGGNATAAEFRLKIDHVRNIIFPNDTSLREKSETV